MLVAFIIIGIIFLILVHELGHFLTAKYFRMRVDEFGIGIPPRAWGKKFGETLYSVNWLPFGGFVRIRGEDKEPEDLAKLSEAEKSRLFTFQAAWKKALVIVAGVAVNLIAGWLLLSAVFAIGTPTLVYVQEVQEGSPAMEAGLLEGDVVTGYRALSEKMITNALTADEFIGFIDLQKGKEMELRILRGSEELFFTVVPRVDTPEGEGAVGVGFVEIGFEARPLGESLWLGLIRTGEVVVLTYQGLGSLLGGIFTSGKVPEGIVGPVGIFSFAYQSGQIGLVYLLQVLGLISVNLAILNLIPFPALDGGQLVFIIIEKIKGTPLKTSTKAMVNAGGIALLLLLVVIVSVRDVWTLVG